MKDLRRPEGMNLSLKTSALLSLGLHIFLIASVLLIFLPARHQEARLRVVRVSLFSKGVEEKTNKAVLQRPAQTRAKNETPFFHSPPPSPDPVQKETSVEPPKPLPMANEEAKPPEPPVVSTVSVSSQPEVLRLSEASSSSLNELPSQGDPPSPAADSVPFSFSGDAEVFSPGEDLGPGPGKGGGFPGRGNGEGANPGHGGLGWRVSGTGTAGPNDGKGNSEGNGRGGAGDRSGKGVGGEGNPGKKGGIWGKLFSSPGGNGTAHPKYAVNPKPPYPPEARERGYQGEVLLKVEVLVNGRVGQIEINKSSGYEILDQSALSTVKRWRFIPAQKEETPISLWVNVPIKFQLQ